MIHELTIAVAPEKEQDFILASLQFREAMPKDLRKHLLGPIVNSDKYRSFVFLPDDTEYREKFIKHVERHPNISLSHIQFGEDTVILDTKIIKELKTEFQVQVKELEKENSALKLELIQVTRERNETISYLNKETVLSEAVKELKMLRGKSKILEKAKLVADDFKAWVTPNHLPESVKNLIDAMKDIDTV